MRVWHKQLLMVLPKKLLLQQWKDVKAIYRGKVDAYTARIFESSVSEFTQYCEVLYGILSVRDWLSDNKGEQFMEDLHSWVCLDFKGYGDWQDDRYLRQCLYILQEMYDVGEIEEGEWKLIEYRFYKYF